MSAEPVQSPSPYSSELSSIIFDHIEEAPIPVALREDMAAHAVSLGFLATAGTALVTELYAAQPPGERLAVGKRPTEHFAIGRVLATSRERVQRPEHTLGLRLSSLDVMLELVAKKEHGEPTRLRRFGPAYAQILRSFAEAVLL